MKFSKILVATDFSPTTETALEVATSLARGNRTEMILVHVVAPPPAYGSEGMVAPIIEYDVDAARRQLEEIEPRAGTGPVRRVVLCGAAADEIVALAHEEHVDLIVIGTHGRRGLSRMLMGSVAEAVVRRARCPVLTVKPQVTSSVTEPESVHA